MSLIDVIKSGNVKEIIKLSTERLQVKSERLEALNEIKELCNEKQLKVINHYEKVEEDSINDFFKNQLGYSISWIFNDKSISKEDKRYLEDSIKELSSKYKR